jgi:hypothetical protein
MPHQYASISTVLKRVHPSYKEALQKKLNLLLSAYYREELPSGDTIVPLSKLFEILGKATYRLDMLSDIRRMLGEALGCNIIGWSAKELEALRTICLEQVKTATAMINATTRYEHKQITNIGEAL